MKVSGARAIVQCLIEQGVDTVFGYPGGTVLPLYDALYDAPLRHVLTVHEQGAAHAADGYARASGRVGVCIATSGPGATNLVTGLAAAYMDSSPVVAITGQVPTSLIGRDAFQEVDITGITLPVTKHNFLVKDPQSLPDILRKAFHIARTGRPGPVLVDVPRDIQTMEIDFSPAAAPQQRTVRTYHAERLEQAAIAIQAAQRPVIMVGGGAISGEAAGEIKLLAETCEIPVVSTLMGLGAFPGSHSLFLGLTGMHGHKIANYAVRCSDVLIAIGSRFSDRVTGNRASYAAGKVVIHIDVDPAEIDKNVAAHIGLAGNMKDLLTQLLSRLRLRRTAEWQEELASQQESKPEYNPDRLTAIAIMQNIAEQTTGKPFVFATDVGQHQMWAAQGLTIENPRSWLTSGGLGAMGFGLPAAIGAQLASPDKRVVHIAGDGGFKMTGAELYTAAVNDLPIISIIINNSCLGMIRQLQHAYFEQHYMSCHLPLVDFVSFARAFGVQATTVESLAEFSRAFAAAVSARAPRVIVANIATQDMVTPMLAAGATLDEYVDI
ncbi:MAG: acetolactate synthase, large subunit, biosynthetic type [Anaerosporomusa subterranea]|nr:acetolactate synthase, large subunit, biosynthetic type [Anaerosporomusa subterranea]